MDAYYIQAFDFVAELEEKKHHIERKLGEYYGVS